MTLTCDEMPRVDDLQQLALKLFEIEKKHLLEEKQEYSCAVVIVITPAGRYYEEADSPRPRVHSRCRSMCPQVRGMGQ